MINDDILNLGCILGIAWLPDVELVFSIVSIIIITGIAFFNFIMKIKKYKEDGKIDDKERADLLQDVEETAEKIKEHIKK